MIEIMSEKSMIESLRPSRNEAVDEEQTKHALLAYEFPDLEERAMHHGLFRCSESYREAFTELKKFLWLCAKSDEQSVLMVSKLIDELWHQFILFTREYHFFCDQFFGRYIHHNGKMTTVSIGHKAGILKFFRAYKENFGPVSRLWLDSPAEKNGFLTSVDAQAWTPENTDRFFR
jgi:hypothetical protein